MVEIKWTAPEYHHSEKDVSWYWLVMIAAILIVVFALWQKNFLFAVFTVIAATLTTAWGRKQPRTFNFTLSDQGLDIGGKIFYPYETLKGFVIVENPDEPELSELILRTTKITTPWLKIIIATQRREAIKEFLSARLPEIEYKETASDSISKFLKL